MSADVKPYIDVLSRFYRDEISIRSFEEIYLSLFKSENKLFDANVFELLNDVFISLDMYVGDDTPLEEGELNDEMLRKKIKGIYLVLLNSR